LRCLASEYAPYLDAGGSLPPLLSSSLSFITTFIDFYFGGLMEYLVALAQGIYFFISGIWPILSMSTFLKVTGPKTDLWLVKTVGLILVVIGVVLIVAQVNREINTSIIVLAIGSAFSLILVEVVYVVKRVISPIYLADALIELLLIGWWVLSLLLS
jgi:hypothetical protein